MVVCSRRRDHASDGQSSARRMLGPKVEEGARRGAWAEAPPKCSAAAAPLSRPRTSTTFNEIRTHCEAYCSTRVRTLSTLIFTYTSTRTRCDSHSTRNPHLHRGLTTFERLKKIGSKAAAIRHTIVHSLRAGIPVPAALIKSSKVKVEPGHLVIVNPVDVARTQTLPLSPVVVALPLPKCIR